MAARMSGPLYTTEILRLAASLHDVHELEREDGRAELRSPTCGSRIAIAVQLDSDRRVTAISQRVNACAFGQGDIPAVLGTGVARIIQASTCRCRCCPTSQRPSRITAAISRARSTACSRTAN